MGKPTGFMEFPRELPLVLSGQKPGHEVEYPRRNDLPRGSHVLDFSRGHVARGEVQFLVGRKFEFW